MQYIGANSLLGTINKRLDGHAHVFLLSLPLTAHRRYSPRYDATPETYFSLLKQYNLDGSLLVQPSFLGADNSYLLSVLQQYADKQFPFLRAVVVLDPHVSYDIGQLKEWSELGVVGVRLNLFKNEGAFNYEDWQGTLALSEKLGWHVELQSVAQYMPYLLPRLVAKHAKVVVDHLGLVDSLEENIGLKCIMSQPKEQIWIKVSGLYRSFPNIARECRLEQSKPLRQLYTDYFSNEHLIWGSDWPFTQHEEEINFEETLELMV